MQARLADVVSRLVGIRLVARLGNADVELRSGLGLRSSLGNVDVAVSELKRVYSVTQRSRGEEQ